MAGISDIATALGRSRIARNVGRTPQAVWNAVDRGFFPATWRPVVEEMAREAGVSVDDTHFFSLGQDTRHVKSHGCAPIASQEGDAA